MQSLSITHLLSGITLLQSTDLCRHDVRQQQVSYMLIPQTFSHQQFTADVFEHKGHKLGCKIDLTAAQLMQMLSLGLTATLDPLSAQLTNSTTGQ